MNLRQMLCCVLALLQLTQTLPVRAEQAPQFTLEQQDRFVIDHMIRTGDKAGYEVSAIAYAVWAASRNYEKDPTTHVEQWDPPASGIDMWGPLEPIEFQVSKESFMNRAAVAEQKSIEGFQVRGTWGEPVIDAVLGVAGAAATPELGAAVPVILPIAKEAVISLISIEPNDPTLSTQVTREMWTWAMAQVRAQTAEGKILEPYLIERKIRDPREDRSDTEAVEWAANKALQLKTDKNVQQLLENDAELKRVFTEMKNLYDAQKTLVQNAPLPKADLPVKIPTPKSKELAEFFGAASKNLDSLSLVLNATNHAKEAEMIARAAKAAKAMEMISKAQEMAGLAAVNVYVYAAVMIYECIAIAQQPGSPYPAIFAMLQQISEQIENLRKELGTRLNQMDTKLSSLMRQSIALDEASLHDIRAVARVVAQLKTELKAIRFESRTQILELANILFEDQDADCFQETGRGVLLPMDQRQFIQCRDRYISRGTNFARGEIANSATGIFAYGDRYEKLRLLFDPQGAEYRVPLANPAVWLQSTYNMARLARNHPEYLSDLEDPNSIDLRIAPLYEAGQDLQKFSHTLLFNEDGSFRVDRVSQLLDQAQEIQATTLNELRDGISKSGINVDPTKKLNQPVNMGFEYQMFAQPIPFCPGVEPRLTSVIDIGFALDGNGYGMLSDSNIQDALKRNGVSVEDVKNMTMAEFAAAPKDQFTWSRSILNQISKDIVLMEQSAFKNAKITPCVSQMDFANLNQHHEVAFDQDISVGLRINLTFDDNSGTRVEMTLQELSASTKLTGASGGGIMWHLLGGTRYRGNVFANWQSFREALTPLLADVSSAEVLANHAAIGNAFNDFLVGKQTEIVGGIQGLLQENQSRFEDVVRDLHAIAAIGLESGGDSLSAWDATVEQNLSSLSPNALTTLMVSEGRTYDEIAAQILGQRTAVNEVLNAASQDKSLRAPGRFTSGLMWLKQIYLAKSIGTGALN